MNANVNHRHSIMAIYPLECFEIDAAQNSMARETTRHGLQIETAPDHDGSFHLRRITKSISGVPEGPHALFICPFMGRSYECFAMLGRTEGAEDNKLNISNLELHEYDAFIDAVIGAALGFTPPGPPHSPPLG
jgi:hypothetical protein